MNANKTIYHYTKGVSINSIFTDGFIATERKRGFNRAAKLTDCVWLTEKSQFPKTALPSIRSMPETNLALHINNNFYVDLDKLGNFVGGVYRFSFSSNEYRFEKWFHSAQRKTVANSMHAQMMERVANKVGDEVRSFWISTDDVALSNFSLEVFKNGAWQMILKDCTVTNLSAAEREIIDEITKSSVAMCKLNNLPVHHLLAA